MEIKIQTVNGMSIGMSIPDALISKIECGQCQPITGDVNGDGKVNEKDAMAIMDHLAGTTPLDEDALKRADVNGDGEVSYLDAMKIMDDMKENANSK